MNKKENSSCLKSLVNRLVEEGVISHKEMFDNNDHLEVLTFLGERWGTEGDISFNKCKMAFIELQFARNNQIQKDYQKDLDAITQKECLILSK